MLDPRIEGAQTLLLEFPGRAVVEIAPEAGFGSGTRFMTAFRENTGKTPTEFRREAGVDIRCMPPKAYQGGRAPLQAQGLWIEQTLNQKGKI